MNIKNRHFDDWFNFVIQLNLNNTSRQTKASIHLETKHQ